MAVLIEVLDGLGDPAAPPPGPPLASQLSAWARKHSLEADPATALRALLAWSRLHGFVSLEIAGDYASMSIDPDPGLRDPASHVDSVTRMPSHFAVSYKRTRQFDQRDQLR